MITKIPGGLCRAILASTLIALSLTSTTATASDHQRAVRQRQASMVLTATQDTALGSYLTDQLRITVTKRVTGSGTDTIGAYLADITTSSPDALRSAFARDTFGRYITETVSTMAQNHNAILAINGDYYGFRDDGIVIRDGVAYRDRGARQGLAIYRDGTFRAYDETTTTASRLLAAGVLHTLSFGPALLQNGQIPDGIDTYEIGDFGVVVPGGLGSIQGYQPRTGIGLIEPNHLVMIVVDGRGAGGSRGASMIEFAQMFQAAGATTAYNLDGGGSATMVFDGAPINNPCFGTERPISDALYLAR